MNTNRRRGHDFERHVAKLFRRWFPDAKRGYQYQGSDKDCDVVGTPYYIECKYAKRRFSNSLYSTWRKAWEKQGIPYNHIFIIRRLAYGPIIVSMNLTVADLLKIRLLFRGIEEKRELASCTWDVFAEAMDKKYGISH